MPDRLQELLQQRALIKEHLAWLEAEIAAASGGKPLPPSPASAVENRLPAAPAAPVALAASVAVVPIRTPVQLKQDAEADALLHRLAAEDEPPAPPSKSGCWTIFSIVLLLLVAVSWMLMRHFYPKDATPAPDEMRNESVPPPPPPSSPKPIPNR